MSRKAVLAVIEEAECVGCTKCIQACPVDAIIGSHKLMHAVLDNECIGCGLCVAPCPVDCIEMVEVEALTFDKGIAQLRAKSKKERQLREAREREQMYREKRLLAKKSS